MYISFDRNVRTQQKAILRAVYPDYDARRHDLFVMRYNREQDAAALAQYHQRRGICPPEHKYEDRSQAQRDIATLGGDPTL